MYLHQSLRNSLLLGYSITLDDDIKKFDPITQPFELTMPKVNAKGLEDHRSEEATATQQRNISNTSSSTKEKQKINQ